MEIVRPALVVLRRRAKMFWAVRKYGYAENDTRSCLDAALEP